MLLGERKQAAHNRMPMAALVAALEVRARGGVRAEAAEGVRVVPRAEERGDERTEQGSSRRRPEFGAIPEMILTLS